MSETTRIDSDHDETLTALYRATAQDGPPSALDDAIRAAARRAVASGPRRTGAALGGWRVPVSIAALIVLSVSLVTLMREEAPELVMPPRAEAPPARLPPQAQQAPADVPQADAGAAAKARSPVAAESAAIGRGPQPAATPPTGPRSATPTPGPEAAARGATPGAPAVASVDNAPLPARRGGAAEAFPGSAESRDRTSVEPPAGAERKAAKEIPARGANRFDESARFEKAPAPRSPAATAHAPRASDADAGTPDAPRNDGSARQPSGLRSESAPPPAAVPSPLGAAQAYLGLPPAKWLDQIEALRKQGRSQEARASFDEFRRRYPDHPLPDSLKDWMAP